MPPPFPFRLVGHDPRWSAQARSEMGKLMAAIPALVEIDHIGSTSIPGICAKPILDLLGACSSIAALDSSRAAFAAVGYVWRGEYGLAGRRYLTKDDPASVNAGSSCTATPSEALRLSAT